MILAGLESKINGYVVGSLEFVLPGQVPGDDGNWRFLVDGDEFSTQKRVSSAWVDVHVFGGAGVPSILNINTDVVMQALESDSIDVVDSAGNTVFYADNDEFFVNAVTEIEAGNPIGLLLALTYAA